MHSQGCMGASIGMHLGFEKAHGDEMARNTVAVIGDSTFIHSGITPLIDLVYNKGTGTVIILDNRVTAMTGTRTIPRRGRPSWARRPMSSTWRCCAAPWA